MRPYWNAVKYVFRNPVEAGLSAKIETYQYSSFSSESERGLWQMTDFLMGPEKQTILDLDWLNQSFKEEQADALPKGLRRREFQAPKDHNGNRTKPEALQRKKGLGT